MIATMTKHTHGNQGELRVTQVRGGHRVALHVGGERVSWTKVHSFRQQVGLV